MYFFVSHYYSICYLELKPLCYGEISLSSIGFNLFVTTFVIILYTILHNEIGRKYSKEFGFSLFSMRETKVLLKSLPMKPPFLDSSTIFKKSFEYLPEFLVKGLPRNCPVLEIYLRHPKN